MALVWREWVGAEACPEVGGWEEGEGAQLDPAEAGSEQMIPDLLHPVFMHLALRRILSTQTFVLGRDLDFI